MSHSKTFSYDSELSNISVVRRCFVKIAKHPETEDYSKDFVPSETYLKKLSEKGLDIFTFLERSWLVSNPNTPKQWYRTEENVALIEVTNYSNWLDRIGKKTRNMIRKAEKCGVITEVAKPNEKLVEGISKIYNETPIRQERPFPHYGQSLKSVSGLIAQTDDTFIASYLEDEIVGFVQLVYGDRIARIAQILSLQKHSDKAINNALVAKAIEVCVARGIPWLMYARMGNHPSLDNFKRNNGFTRTPVSRYYVPITKKGEIAIKMGLHKPFSEILPERMRNRLIPLYNWFSRAKVRLK